MEESHYRATVQHADEGYHYSAGIEWAYIVVRANAWRLSTRPGFPPHRNAPALAAEFGRWHDWRDLESVSAGAV